MSFSFVTSVATDGSNEDDVTSSAIDTSGAELLIAVVSYYVPSGVPVLSDSKGNTWQLAVENDGNHGLSNRASAIFFANAISVGSGHTVTATGVETSPSIVIYAFSHTDATQFQVDFTSNVVDGPATYVEHGAVSPTVADSLLVISAAVYPTVEADAVDASFIGKLYAENNEFSTSQNSAYLIQSGGPSSVYPGWDLWDSFTGVLIAAVFSPSTATGIVPILNSYRQRRN